MDLDRILVRKIRKNNDSIAILKNLMQATQVICQVRKQWWKPERAGEIP
jgi:hypothetical protein